MGRLVAGGVSRVGRDLLGGARPQPFAYALGVRERRYSINSRPASPASSVVIVTSPRL
jgi:hypothetical protein